MVSNRKQSKIIDNKYLLLVLPIFSLIKNLNFIYRAYDNDHTFNDIKYQFSSRLFAYSLNLKTNWKKFIRNLSFNSFPRFVDLHKQKYHK